MLPRLSNEEWAKRLRNRYGCTQDLFRTLSVDRLEVYAMRFAEAIESNTPTLMRLVKAYGIDVMTALMEVLVTAVVMQAGEEQSIDAGDVKAIARSICQSSKTLNMNIASVMVFFHRFGCGEIEIYGKVTPRKVMEAMQKYAIMAGEREYRAMREAERRRKEAERKEHERMAISFEEYKRQRGFGAEVQSPMDLILANRQ